MMRQIEKKVIRCKNTTDVKATPTYVYDKLYHQYTYTCSKCDGKMVGVMINNHILFQALYTYFLVFMINNQIYLNYGMVQV